jgi:hypothetical protein
MLDNEQKELLVSILVNGGFITALVMPFIVILSGPDLKKMVRAGIRVIGVYLVVCLIGGLFLWI